MIGLTSRDVQEFQSQLLSMDSFESKPLKRVKVGLIRETLEQGVDSGVRKRILMGTYTLSAGYYKQAQQVDFKAALDQNDILISPAASYAAYKTGEKFHHTEHKLVSFEGGLSGLPVGPQMIGAAFDEEKLLKVGDIFEQTLKGSGFVPTMLQNVA
ncbi:hypothetical protein Bca101_081824 [Brassica carinata]